MFFSIWEPVLIRYGIVVVAQSGMFLHDQEHDAPSYVALEAAAETAQSLEVDLSDAPAIAIIDFTRPAWVARLDLYTPDRCGPSRHLCAHGRKTGEIWATDFSNISGSNQTSLGMYRVAESYRGSFGLSLKLDGLQPGINDKARARSIVLHSAWYVNNETILLNILEGLGPRIGRSLGCPAVSEDEIDEVVQALRPGSLLFIHGEG